MAGMSELEFDVPANFRVDHQVVRHQLGRRATPERALLGLHRLTRHELSKVVRTNFSRLSRAQNRQIKSVTHRL